MEDLAPVRARFERGKGILDLGDLTADKEMLLACPVNKIGPVDIYVINHHGSITSNSPLFLNGIAPRVAIQDNGETKGGDAKTPKKTK